MLIVLGCQTSGYKWYSGTVEKAKSKAGTKLILLEFYTDTWPACHRLDAETFSDLTVQSFSRSNLISLKLDANDETGNKYFKDYNCEGVPHLLFVDQKGEEVDRIIGYLPPGEYLSRIQDILENKHTLDDYLTHYKNGEVNAELIAGIAMKYEDRGDSDNAKEFYSILIKDYPEPSSEYYQRGTYYLASYAFDNGDQVALNTYITSFPESPFIEDAYFTMVYHYADKEMREEELKIYTQMLANFPENTGVLNSYAWRMAEIETNLEDALQKVKRAVQLAADDPQRQANIIDTEAEVLWKLKRFDEAIEAIERAIVITPENQYFRDQKEKFIQSKKGDSQPAWFRMLFSRSCKFLNPSIGVG